MATKNIYLNQDVEERLKLIKEENPHFNLSEFIQGALIDTQGSGGDKIIQIYDKIMRSENRILEEQGFLVIHRKTLELLEEKQKEKEQEKIELINSADKKKKEREEQFYSNYKDFTGRDATELEYDIYKEDDKGGIIKWLRSHGIQFI